MTKEFQSIAPKTGNKPKQEAGKGVKIIGGGDKKNFDEPTKGVEILEKK